MILSSPALKNTLSFFCLSNHKYHTILMTQLYHKYFSITPCLKVRSFIFCHFSVIHVSLLYIAANIRLQDSSSLSLDSFSNKQMFLFIEETSCLIYSAHNLWYLQLLPSLVNLLLNKSNSYTSSMISYFNYILVLLNLFFG